MKRNQFLKSILTLLITPKILVSANDYIEQRERRWKENRQWAKRNIKEWEWSANYLFGLKYIDEAKQT